MQKLTSHLDLATASVAHLVSQASHDTSSGVFDMIARWVAHAALWRIMGSLGLPAAIAVGVAAVLFMVHRSRRRNRG
ncbi:hypothetical protein [Sinomonas gamaensis]|uniref:hypothetical protein n=1 Tax=Sinomonas gamaensis TaxID=2565624 RepID=UPI001107E5BE|nr:hypothetical protein [Sinomonas gamaensis]